MIEFVKRTRFVQSSDNRLFDNGTSAGDCRLFDNGTSNNYEISTGINRFFDYGMSTDANSNY